MPTYRLNDGRELTADDPAALVEELRVVPAADVPAGSVFHPSNTALGFRRGSAARVWALVPGLAVRDAPVADWYADMRQHGVIDEVPPPDKAPDFERGVMVILATFAAFTGFTISGSLKLVPDIGYPADWRWWAFFALVALLLRYIFGSAVHLNGLYVGKSLTRPLRGWIAAREAPKSQSIALLFKDLAFLVIFGMIAVYIQQAAEKRDVDVFIVRCMWFVEAGLLWSVSDYFLRRCAICRVVWWADWIFIPLFLLLFLWQLFTPDLGMRIGLGTVMVVLGLALVFMDAFGHLGIPRNPGNTSEWPSAFWQKWVPLDALQFLAALVIWSYPSGWPAAKAAVLALVFGAVLYRDFYELIRAAQRGET